MPVDFYPGSGGITYRISHVSSYRQDLSSALGVHDTHNEGCPGTTRRARH